jgi:hypothetical protein
MAGWQRCAQSACVAHSQVLHLPAVQVPPPSQAVPSGSGVPHRPVAGSQAAALHASPAMHCRVPQVPSAGAPSAATQVWQGPLQAASQQIPATQCPPAHSASDVQVLDASAASPVGGSAAGEQAAVSRVERRMAREDRRDMTSSLPRARRSFIAARERLGPANGLLDRSPARCLRRRPRLVMRALEGEGPPARTDPPPGGKSAPRRFHADFPRGNRAPRPLPRHLPARETDAAAPSTPPSRPGNGRRGPFHANFPPGKWMPKALPRRLPARAILVTPAPRRLPEGARGKRRVRAR